MPLWFVKVDLRVAVFQELLNRIGLLERRRRRGTAVVAVVVLGIRIERLEQLLQQVLLECVLRVRHRLG